jgi:drug/metabolite transporter (DMT)-like permease
MFMMVYLPGLISQLGRAPLASSLAVAYLGVFPAAIGYVLWSFALSRADVSRVTSTLNLSPILSFVIAFLALGEVPAPLSLVGGVITVAGVILLNTLGKAKQLSLPRRAHSE